jgi:hypothetical protein
MTGADLCFRIIGDPQIAWNTSESRHLNIAGSHGFVMDRICLWDGDHIHIVVISDNYHLVERAESMVPLVTDY